MDNNTHLRDLEFVSLDLETLGLAPALDPILELAAVFFRRSGRTLRTYSSLCDPGMAIPQRIQKLTRITPSMVEGKPSPGEVVTAFLEQWDETPPIILAHGVATDLAFLRENAQRLGIELPPLLAIDTVPLARLAIPGMANYKLETLARALFPIKETDSFHRALTDAEMTRDLFLHCLEVSPRPLHTLNDLDRTRALVREPTTPPPLPPFPERANKLVDWTRRGETIEVIYRSGTRKGRWRPIEPQTFYTRSGHYYLRGRCLESMLVKEFRLDRIARFRIAKKTACSEANPE